jgi:hypothetical protein
MANGDDDGKGFIRLPAAVFAVMMTIGFSVTAAYVSDTLSTMRSRVAQLENTIHDLEAEWKAEEKRCEGIRERQNERLLKLEVLIKSLHRDEAHLLK